MPCYITGSAEGDLRLHYNELHDSATQTNDMLCRLCHECETQNVNLPKDIKEWYKKHKKQDKENKKREQKEVAKKFTKEKALSKLNKEEREALGY